MSKMIITIDGPAASGKGTVARMLAKNLNLDYFDSGIIYRKLAYHIMEVGIDPHNTYNVLDLCKKINFFDNDVSQYLRSEKVAKLASIIASNAEIRGALKQIQRSYADQVTKGLVTDGRDMGTVIFPDANHKFFLTADVNIRAERRYKELQTVNKDVIQEQVLQELIDRDKRDSARETAPLKPADDAIIIDSSYQSPEQIVSYIINLIANNE